MRESLTEIRDLVFQQQTVSIDGKYYIGCVFKECDLQYHGGPVMFLETAVVGCRWHFGEAAHRTINLLQLFGLEVPDVALDEGVRVN